MKFLHTADWQIGMKCLVAGDRAADAREERIRTIDRIVEVANRHAVEFVVIAGDLFDSATPKPTDIGSRRRSAATIRDAGVRVARQSRPGRKPRSLRVPRLACVATLPRGNDFASVLVCSRRRPVVVRAVLREIR